MIILRIQFVWSSGNSNAFDAEAKHAPSRLKAWQLCPFDSRLASALEQAAEECKFGIMAEAIEQPISAPAASQVGEPVRMWFVRDVRSQTYGNNPSSSCSPGLSTQARGALRAQSSQKASA